jgi:hypothetical protein
MTIGSHPFRFAALTSLALILPFLILEARHGLPGRGGALGVVLLFGLLWLLPTLSIGSSLRLMRRTDGAARNRGRILLAAAIVLAAALVWGTILADQLGCFLGAANCD